MMSGRQALPDASQDFAHSIALSLRALVTLSHHCPSLPLFWNYTQLLLGVLELSVSKWASHSPSRVKLHGGLSVPSSAWEFGASEVMGPTFLLLAAGSVLQLLPRLGDPI